MKAQEVTELPRTDPPFIAATGYLAVLAYPDDRDKRDQLVNAIRAFCAKALRSLGRTELPQDLLVLPARDMRRRLTKAKNIIWFERFPALHAANEILLTRTTKNKNIRFYGHETVLAACEKYAPISQQKTHFYQRAWLPSRQILHLIQPFYSFCAYELKHERLVLARYVSRDPSWVIKAVHSAASLRQVFVDVGIINEPGGILARTPQVDLRLSRETFPLCHFW